MLYFPVFMDLREKAVLVVGGGQVAARKVRALIECGARVSVVATALGKDLTARHDRGEIDWVATAFRPRQVDGYWLVFAATDVSSVNQEVFQAGERRGVPVNVVDDLAHCRFISPAVVNREPVQVAVSTGGASPMLARAVRNWIEELLPGGLGKVAEVVGWLRRQTVRHQSLAERRRTWEFLFDRARVVRWSALSRRAIEREIRAAFSRNKGRRRAGKVYLVGAGPGRADLLTLRAVEILQQADLILHDRLVPDAILDRARRDAERIDVGKRAGDQQAMQERIFELMVDAARAGRTVVRLKGGDAFVFGRGGEELQHLRKHGIDYEVVPGITAALGCAAYAGIPLTHRDHAQQLSLVTGHLAGRSHEGAGDVGAMVSASGLSHGGQGRTLVVYMGVGRARRMRHELLGNGVPDSMPAALIVDGTMDSQSVFFGTVSTLPAMAARVAGGAPGLFVIGEVAALGTCLV